MTRSADFPVGQASKGRVREGFRAAAGWKTCDTADRKACATIVPSERKTQTSARGRQRRLIVNADDFGLSHGHNVAVIRAHREGILTSASLMVNERGTAEAVALAKENPRLAVGLHLTLVCGHSALERRCIPQLVNSQGAFSANPVAAGFNYYFNRDLRRQLTEELEAQFAKFRATGLSLDHVNGHLHLHLHPVVFSILMRHAEAWSIRCLRLVRDPFWLNSRITAGRWPYRASHALIYSLLCFLAGPALRRRGIRHTRFVFGLLQNARVDERYLTALLSRLPPGDSELYLHPSLDQLKYEFDALVSPQVKAQIDQQDVQLIRYRDL
jgi:hopanoid biosynthesis associated protein HpnK